MHRIAKDCLAVITFTFVIALNPVNAQGDLSEDPVYRAFHEYKTAILNDDADAAVAQIDSKTLDFYHNALNDALNLSDEGTRQLPFVTMLTVLQVRHMIPAETVRGMDAEGLFKYAVASGWVGKNSVTNIDIVGVDRDGDFAIARYATGGVESPVGFQFNREQDVWRIDLTSVMPLANITMTRLAEREGVTPDELAIMLLETVSGRMPDQSVWQPINR